MADILKDEAFAPELAEDIRCRIGLSAQPVVPDVGRKDYRCAIVDVARDDATLFLLTRRRRMPDETLSPTPARAFRRRAMIAELSSLFALAISSLALALGVYQARLMNVQTALMQSQSRASVWPYISIGYSIKDTGDNRGYTWEINNDGVGPARIESVTVDVDGKPVSRWNDVFRAVFGEAPVDATYSQIYGKVLPPNTNRETTIEAVRILDVDQAKAFYTAQKRIEMTICYCSVYGDCWVAHRRSPKVQTVVRCETPDVQFEPQM